MIRSPIAIAMTEHQQRLNSVCQFEKFCLSRGLPRRSSHVRAPEPRHSFLSPYLQLSLDLSLPGRITPDQVPLNKKKKAPYVKAVYVNVRKVRPTHGALFEALMDESVMLKLRGKMSSTHRNIKRKNYYLTRRQAHQTWAL